MDNDIDWETRCHQCGRPKQTRELRWLEMTFYHNPPMAYCPNHWPPHLENLYKEPTKDKDTGGVR